MKKSKVDGRRASNDRAGRKIAEELGIPYEEYLKKAKKSLRSILNPKLLHTVYDPETLERHRAYRRTYSKEYRTRDQGR
jgi:hypothetical protein